MFANTFHGSARTSWRGIWMPEFRIRLFRRSFTDVLPQDVELALPKFFGRLSPILTFVTRTRFHLLLTRS